jgi:adenylate cyclase
MGVEIERKFLVHKELVPDLTSFKFDMIHQGYLSSNPDLTIRIRLKNDSAYLTFKGKSQGISRKEIEIMVDSSLANELISDFHITLLEKKRFYIPYGQLTIELDIFEGKLEGLVLAEIELTHENQSIEFPSWFSKEVSNDPAFYNVNLLKD